MSGGAAMWREVAQWIRLCLDATARTPFDGRSAPLSSGAALGSAQARDFGVNACRCCSLAHSPISFCLLSGMANYRDQMHLRFLRRLRSSPKLPFAFVAVGFPTFLFGMSAVTKNTAEQRKEAFMAKYTPPAERVATMNWKPAEE